MAKKKKVVHWSKLPRTKLIGMVKKLELQVAKLKTQLAEARETKLLNERERTTEAALAEKLGVDAPAPKPDDEDTISGMLFPWEQP